METHPTGRLERAVDSTLGHGINRVLVLAYRDLDDPTAGGSEVYVHEVLRAWAAAGLNVDLRTVGVADGPAHITRDSYSVNRRGGHTLGVLRTTAAAALRLRRHADAVVEIWNGLPFWTPLWWHGPQVAVLHHLHDELWQSNFPKPVAQVGSYIERRVAPRAYRNTPIATLSDSSGLDIAARTALESEQITVVPPGIGDVFKPSRARSTDPLIVAAGRFVPAKRFDAVVTAFAELHRVRPAARLVLVGEGPEREALQSQIRSLGLSGVVELPGWIEESRLIDLYSQAWLLAAASISEGWGMTITEAAACATAAVASDVVGHRDAMKYSEGRLVANDVELAEAMVDLTADADVNGQLGRAARESSKRLSWAATAADVLDLLIGDAERRR